MLARVLRTLLRWLTSLSAALCVLTFVFWVRSYWIYDYVGVIGTRGALNSDWAGGSWHGAYRHGLTSTSSAVLQLTWRRQPASVVRNLWTYEQGETVYLRIGDRFFVRYYPDDPSNKRVYDVFAPAWLPPIILSPGLWMWARRKYRHFLAHTRRKAGLCVACGYDIRESSGRCPECGEAIPAPIGDRHDSAPEGSR
jgi:hypothetical protein